MRIKLQALLIELESMCAAGVVPAQDLSKAQTGRNVVWMRADNLLQSSDGFSAIFCVPAQDLSVGAAVFRILAAGITGSTQKIKCLLAFSGLPAFHGAKLVQRRGILWLKSDQTFQQRHGFAPAALLFKFLCQRRDGFRVIRLLGQ